MIDLHAHILPGVDDGPQTEAEALEMIKLAYQDGVRGIVLTPHRNHFLDFDDGAAKIDSAFNRLQYAVGALELGGASASDQPMTLHLGCELYIRGDYLAYIDGFKEQAYQPLCLGNSRYVLIEFERHATLDYMCEAIFELKVRGLCAIIAHVELYQAVNFNLEKVNRLRNAGALIQVTASHIYRDSRSPMSVFLQAAITGGSVDFVASDCHSVEKRRPRLSPAFTFVVSLIGLREANALFRDNAAMLLAGRDLSHLIKTYGDATGDSGRKHLGINGIPKTLIATACVCLLLVTSASFLGMAGIGPMQGLAAKDRSDVAVVDKLVKDNSSTGTVGQVSESTLASAGEVQMLGNIQETSSGQEGNAKSNVSGTNQVQVTKQSQVAGGSEVTDEKTKIEGRYYQELLVLQNSYEASVEGYASLIKEAREQSMSDDERKRVINGYLDQISTLEEISDNDVYALLYEMQNALEAGRFSVEKVKAYREGYHAIKTEKKSYYIDQIEMKKP